MTGLSTEDSRPLPPPGRLALRVARALQDAKCPLVLAESCTCGLIAATLGAIPGISRWFCGSAVVYQEATKSAWLDVAESLIATRGVVSGEVAEEMAVGALAATPHAGVAAAVTGHLGPDAPKPLDGVVYAAVAFRSADSGPANVRVERLTLAAGSGTPLAIRLRRRKTAAAFVLNLLHEALSQRT